MVFGHSKLNLNGFKLGDTIMRIGHLRNIEVATVNNITAKNIILQMHSGLGLREYKGDLSGWVLFNIDRYEEAHKKLIEINSKIFELQEETKRLFK